MRSRWAQIVLGAVGLVAVFWAVVLAADPVIVCRDTVMRPGQVCANADGTRTQTYAERYAAAQGARPVIGVLGVAVIGFAFWLSRSAREPLAAAQDSNDIGP